MGLFDKFKKSKEEKVNNECSFCGSPEMVSIMKTLEKELTICSVKAVENFAVEIWDEPFAFVQSVEFQIKTAGNEIAYLGCYEACRTGKMEYMFNDFWLKIPNLNLSLHTFDGKLPVDIAKIYGRKEFLRRLKTLEEPEAESKTVYEDMLEQMNAYNWGSGFSLPTKVLKNEECDLALAMKIFYLADGYTYLDSLGETKEFPVKWYRFIDKLYKDILEGKYINTDRHFIIPLTKVQKYKLNKKNIEQIFLEDI